MIPGLRITLCMFGFTSCGNEPPRWHDAPTTLSIGQGQSKSISLDVIDPEGGEVSVDVTAPPGIAVAADEHLRLFAGYTVAGQVDVEVRLSDPDGETTAVSIALEVAALRWHARQVWAVDGPQAREHPAIIVDEAGGRLLMIGGSGYSPYLEPLADVWEYVLTTGRWSSITPTGDVPAGGGSRRVAQIPDTSRAFLFGGYGANGTAHNQLYEVDFSDGGASFTRVSQSNPPPRRSLHAFVYDATGDGFVTFGGIERNDTWMMQLNDGAAEWIELSFAEAPTPRYGFFWGLDAEHRRLIVFSGAQGGNPIDPAHDTWALELGAEPPRWTLIVDGDAPGAPTGRRNGCMVLDPSGPRLLVFGGTADAQTTEPGLFALDVNPGREAWTQLNLSSEPPIRSSGIAVYDPAGDRVLFGFGNTATEVFQDFTPLGY